MPVGKVLSGVSIAAFVFCCTSVFAQDRDVEKVERVIKQRNVEKKVDRRVVQDEDIRIEKEHEHGDHDHSRHDQDHGHSDHDHADHDHDGHEHDGHEHRSEHTPNGLAELLASFGIDMDDHNVEVMIERRDNGRQAIRIEVSPAKRDLERRMDRRENVEIERNIRRERTETREADSRPRLDRNPRLAPRPDRDIDRRENRFVHRDEVRTSDGRNPLEQRMNHIEERFNSLDRKLERLMQMMRDR